MKINYEKSIDFAGDVVGFLIFAVVVNLFARDLGVDKATLMVLSLIYWKMK